MDEAEMSRNQYEPDRSIWHHGRCEKRQGGLCTCLLETSRDTCTVLLEKNTVYENALKKIRSLAEAIPYLLGYPDNPRIAILQQDFLEKVDTALGQESKEESVPKPWSQLPPHPERDEQQHVAHVPAPRKAREGVPNLRELERNAWDADPAPEPPPPGEWLPVDELERREKNKPYAADPPPLRLLTEEESLACRGECDYPISRCWCKPLCVVCHKGCTMLSAGRANYRHGHGWAHDNCRSPEPGDGALPKKIK